MGKILMLYYEFGQPSEPETLRYVIAVFDRPGYLNNTYVAQIGVYANGVIDSIGV